MTRHFIDGDTDAEILGYLWMPCLILFSGGKSGPMHPAHGGDMCLLRTGSSEPANLAFSSNSALQSDPERVILNNSFKPQYSCLSFSPVQTLSTNLAATCLLDSTR
jgi:hypothetical protein